MTESVRPQKKAFMSNSSLHQNKPDRVTMIGLDFGSTTSSAMVATAGVGMNSATGKMAFGTPKVVYRSEPVFTPFNDKIIDQVRLNGYLDQWITDSRVDCTDLFAGGVIITGLAAKKINADTLARLVGQRIGEAIIATADDPCLESWLAYMGSCSVLSRFHPQTPFINFDIGGGTTNPALGINGSVTSTGCYFIGARHFKLKPGSYLIEEISDFGRSLLAHFSIYKDVGDTLTPSDTNTILEFYVDAIEAMVVGDEHFFSTPIARLHQQVPFSFDPNSTTPALTFSGGVGELIYRIGSGEELPGTTYYGDLGIDLAIKITQSSVLSAFIHTLVPENMGRATVYGLALHSTEVSGTTIFLSRPDILPCKDLPIVARLSINAPAGQLGQALKLVETSQNGACIQVLSGKKTATINGAMHTPVHESLAKIKSFGQRLAHSLENLKIKPQQKVVLLVPDNYGQALGNYASNWRQSPADFIVIDEIPDRNAHFVNIGRPRNNIVPVSFYGVY
jgi:ethanolamine utilization protein EutA